MELLFTIVDAPLDANMQGQSKRFAGNSETTLGRAAGNTWVLPDSERIVSSFHASITFQNGSFVLTDNSTNGTFLNDNPVPLGAGNSAPLKDGDTVTIGRYLLRATLVQQQPAAKLPDGLGTVDFLDQGTAAAPKVAPPHAPAMDAMDAMDAKDRDPLEAQPDEFDKWLEPQAQRSPQPWMSIEPDSASMSGDAAETDPLAALDKYEGVSSANDLWADPQPEEDPEWWKTSFSDHAPASSHAMNPVYVRPEQQPWAPAFDRPASAQQPPHNPPPGSAANTDRPPAPETPPPGPLFPESDTAPNALDNGTPGAATPAAPNPGHPPAGQQPPGTPPGAAGGYETTAPNPNNAYAQPPVSNMQPPASTTTEPAQNRPAQAAPQPGLMQQQPPAGEIRALAQALGFNQLTPQQEAALLPEASAIIREAIGSLMNLLSARAAIKNELRVDRTMIKPAENNPLKFSPNAQEALAAMFTSTSAAFLSPSAAVREGFEDISDHQIAVLVGMKTAFDTMLSHFDPSRLERKLNKNDNRALLTSKKARLWENYLAHFQELKQDRETTYRELFGDAFAEAYEQQLIKLKGMRKQKS